MRVPRACLVAVAVVGHFVVERYGWVLVVRRWVFGNQVGVPVGGRRRFGPGEAC